MHKTSFLVFLFYSLVIIIIISLCIFTAILVGKSFNCFYNLRTFNENVNINTIIINSFVICMLKKLQLRVCEIVNVRVLFFLFVDGHEYAHLFLYIAHPFLTARSSNAARSLRTALTWTWQLTYTFTPIILISCVVHS